MRSPGVPGARRGLPGPQQLSLRTALAATLPVSAQWPGCRHPQQPWQAAREASEEEEGGGEAGCPLGLHVMVIVLIPASRADGGGGSGSMVAAAAAVGLEWRGLCHPCSQGQTEARTVRDVRASQRLRKAHLQMACTEQPHSTRGPRREGSLTESRKTG